LRTALGLPPMRIGWSAKDNLCVTGLSLAGLLFTGRDP
jgi:hypothetical protein